MTTLFDIMEALLLGAGLVVATCLILIGWYLLTEYYDGRD